MQVLGQSLSFVLMMKLMHTKNQKLIQTIIF
jgi:hypothetical protein